MSRKPPLGEGETSRTACAGGLLRTGVEEKTGEALPAGVVAERVGWCADLVAGMAAALITGHWNTADVDVLASGADAGGRRLPSNAWMALRRLGWAVAGEWDAVRAAVPDGAALPSGVIRSRTRQIAAFVGGRGRMPVDVFETEAAPRVPRMLLLAACDRQQATIERADAPADNPGAGGALLRLRLPTRPDPGSYRDWTWVACPIVLPPTVPPGAVLHLPTLRPHRGAAGPTVRADLSYTHPVPAARRTGHTVALGVDWGLNTLLSAAAARLHHDGMITAPGSGGMFRAPGVLAKQHRLRRQSERLHAKADHYRRLTQDATEHPLAARLEVLRGELGYVGDRRRNLNDALARSAARWTVDQAIAAAATVIYLEDLRSMEAAGMGRTLNTRLSQTVRGKIVDWIRHIAGEAGIAVVTVPARGTSRHCPRCLNVLRHCKAPDRPAAPGWKWARCDACGYQGDRDMGACKRIAARGLTHQTKTVTDRTSGTMAIRSVRSGLETGAVITPAPTIDRGDRSKTGPTRQQTPRPAPRRRRAPSPARPPRRAGQRPEGHAPTDRRLPRAAHRNQDVTTTSTPTTWHQPRGGALGAGFHLHAHASPPRWADPPPGTSLYGIATN